MNTVTVQQENIVVVNVNLQQINQLSQLGFVQRIDIPVSGTLVNHNHSEGVEFSFADDLIFEDIFLIISLKIIVNTSLNLLIYLNILCVIFEFFSF